MTLKEERDRLIKEEAMVREYTSHGDDEAKDAARWRWIEEKFETSQVNEICDYVDSQIKKG
jgi:hypothetical protein